MTPSALILRLVEDDVDSDMSTKDFLNSQSMPLFTPSHNQVNYLPLGSVSSGTMCSEHLIRRFLDTLDSVDEKRAQDIRQENSELFVINGEDGEDDPETLDYFVQELMETLQEFAPPFTYFGAHPGDGADYGVWVVDDVEEDIEEGMDDGSIGEAKSDSSGRIIPNASYELLVKLDDIKNAMALYRGSDGKELWSVE